MGTDKGLKLFDGDVLTLGQTHITNVHLRTPDEIIFLSNEIAPYTVDDAKYFHGLAEAYYNDVSMFINALGVAMKPLSQKREESSWVLVDPSRKDAGSYDGRRPQGTYAGSELFYFEEQIGEIYGFGDTAVKYEDRPGYALVKRSDLIRQISYESDGFIYGQFPEFTTANPNYIAFVEATNYIGSDKQKQLLKDYPIVTGKLTIKKPI